MKLSNEAIIKCSVPRQSRKGMSSSVDRAACWL
jgi:hypothetical protein